MDNLKSALNDITDAKADEIVQALLDRPTPWGDPPREMIDFIYEAAQTLMGFHHGSSYYDSGEWRADYSQQEDESGYIDIDVELSDVKDDFGAEFVVKLEGSALRDLKSFTALYNFAKEHTGFDGTVRQFEKVIKKSRLFADKAFELVTRYDG